MGSSSRKNEKQVLEGVVWDDNRLIGLADICGRCGVHAELVTEMVEYGIIEPVSDDQRQFTGTSLRRVTTVIRLQRDLGVNLAGAALALDLMDELAELRRQVVLKR